MANTYSQISIHVVFVVKYRQALIAPAYQEDLNKYLSGILANKKAKTLAINGYRDHIHLFFGMPLTLSISELTRDLKSCSSKWINEHKFIQQHFEWQDGYGAFSYSKSQRDRVIKYIINQEEHHRKITFRKEYLKLLDDFGIEYRDKYLFEFFD